MGLRIQDKRRKAVLKRQSLPVFFGLCQKRQQKVPHTRIKFVDAHDVEHLLEFQDLRYRRGLFHSVSPEGVRQAGDLSLKRGVPRSAPRFQDLRLPFDGREFGSEIGAPAPQWIAYPADFI
jgi:hypothetical protein